MEVILVLLIVAVLNGAVAFIDSMLADLVPMTLHADQYMTAASGGSMVDVLFQILLGFGVSLIILKFLKKGFECYVMWTDGDPDSEPTQLIIRFVQAIAVAVCFPVMYGWLADITESLTNQLITAIGASTNYDWQAWVNGLSSAGLVTAIFGLVFVICYFILYFQFLMRGVEIMILRIGLPLACTGLLDNDNLPDQVFSVHGGGHGADQPLQAGGWHDDECGDQLKRLLGHRLSGACHQDAEVPQ